MELRHRFDLHLNDEVKKFLWILATLLAPRFEKLDFFKGCEDLMSPDKRTRYAACLRIEYNKHYKNKVFAQAEASGPASHATGSSASCTAVPKHYKNKVFAQAEASGPASHATGSSASCTAVPRKRKRESVSSFNVLASSDAEDDSLTHCSPAALASCNLGAHK